MNTLDRINRIDKWEKWLNRYHTERVAFFDLAPLKEEVAIYPKDRLKEAIYTAKGEFWGFREFAPYYYGGQHFTCQFLKGEKCPSPILFRFKEAPNMIRVPKKIDFGALPSDDGSPSSLAIIQIAETSKIKSFDSKVLLNLGAISDSCEGFRKI